MNMHFTGSRCRFAKAGARNVTDDAARVTCRTCRKGTTWLTAAIDQKKAREEAYAAAEPTTVRSPWGDGEIVCRECGGNLFRSWGRSLDRHNHKCASCGHMNHTLTETGMSA